jgi:ABC-type transport system substrate-binding protein
MISRLSLVGALVLLTGCAQQGAAPAASPSTSATASIAPIASPSPATATPEPTTANPDDLSEADKSTLQALLGPAISVSCPLTRANRQQCGKIYAATVPLVDIALSAMESMPKTKPYKDMAGAGALFKKTYGTMVSLGCFKPAAPKNLDLCVSLSDVASLTYLSFTTPLVL